MYLALNVLLIFTQPYSSKWHYTDHTPVPIETSLPSDAELSVEEIAEILHSIDVAYKAREPSQAEQLWYKVQKFMLIVFFPSTIVIIVDSFMGYMGPSTQEQQEFTISVKRRYNHLAKLAIEKGLTEDGFMYQLDASLSKTNGPAFSSFR